MGDILAFLAAPFLACVILVGIHGYLGLHVLRREVIFVDLALAQIAAFGAVVAFLFGHRLGTPGAFAFSLGATVVGAAVFSWTRTHGRVPQEALIGITYVIASAATILVADQAPEGAEHFQELLAGSLIWVTWPVVIKDLVVYSAVGLFHYLFRHRFILITEDPREAERRGWSLHWWDFLFYLSFGLVITLSVEIGGVLMVFTYLVAPAIIALASSASWGRRIAIAWGVGLTGSAIGLIASYRWDFPTGPAVVCALGAILLLFALWRKLGRAGDRGAARAGGS